MAWFKVDDGFYSHHKVILIPRSARAEAIGTWVLCGTWSADKLKDGYIPTFMVEELGGTIDGAEALVTVRLWRKKGAGYQFINWSEFQPTRKSVEEAREKERLRKAGYRSKPNNGATESADVPTGQTRIPDTPTRPDPTRPSPSKEGEKRAIQVPKNFTITDPMRAWAATETPLVNVDEKLPAWIDYWTGVGKPQKDWVAVWRNGMRKQQEFALRDNPGAKAPKRKFTPHAD